VGHLNAPFNRNPVSTPAQGNPAGALDTRSRRFLWIIIVVAGIVALTHQSLTAALASAAGDSALKAAYAILTWPLPMGQPILSGIAAVVLLGIALRTNGWRQVTARQSRLVLGFAIAATLGASPEVLLFAMSFVAFVLVVSFGLMFLLVLLLLRILTRRLLGSRRGENIRAEFVLAPACPSCARRRGGELSGAGRVSPASGGCGSYR
jgi:hypothetical protein